MNPEHWLRTSIAGMSVRPSSRSRNTPLPGSKWSGVQVQYTMQSRSEGLSEALASAFRVAARARLAPVSPSETQCRVRIPERCLIHSSEVSIIRDSSSLVTTRSGTWNPVAINSVCGIAVPCGRRPMGQDFAPGPPKQGSHGSRSHPRAVRRRAGRAAPPRRSQAGAGRRQPRGRWGGRGLRTPPHVRGGHRTERAVRLERPHRPERGGDAGVARVRRPGEGHPHASGLLRRGDGLSDGRTVGPRGDMTRQMVVLLGCLTFPLSPFPFPGLSAQKRAITFDDFIALKSVSDPQLSPDGKWVAYTVTEYSLKDNRGTARVWLADVATGQTRRLTEGPGSDRQPRWSPDGATLAFVSTRQNGSQLWILPIAGGEARRVTNLPDGVSDPVWLPDGGGLVVTRPQVARRSGDRPAQRRLPDGSADLDGAHVAPLGRLACREAAAPVPRDRSRQRGHQGHHPDRPRRPHDRDRGGRRRGRVPRRQGDRVRDARRLDRRGQYERRHLSSESRRLRRAPAHDEPRGRQHPALLCGWAVVRVPVDGAPRVRSG